METLVRHFNTRKDNDIEDHLYLFFTVQTHIQKKRIKIFGRLKFIESKKLHNI